MARARNIKPGFFQNEELVELPFVTRLLFIGLWTIADRSGRLEDKPKKIKMALFPADNIDANESLTELAAKDFILRYEIDGIQYIQILAFEKHQNPHRDEKISIIPAPCKHDASTVPALCKPDGNLADSLIPDSLLLIPDTPPPQRSVEELPIPDFVPIELWHDFIEVRKALKAKNTMPAIKALITQLKKLQAQGHDAVEVINQSIRASWKDLYPLKAEVAKQSFSKSPPKDWT